MASDMLYSWRASKRSCTLYSEQVGKEIEQKRLDTVDRQAGKAVQSTVSNSMRGLKASRRATYTEIQHVLIQKDKFVYKIL
jgi:hypothetical protein